MQKKLENKKLLEIELHKKIARNYSDIREKNRSSAYYNNYWAKKMLSLLKIEPMKILDYGCGTGRLYPIIKRMFNSSYLGIDLSNDMLNVAKKKFKGIAVKQEDGEDLKLKNNSFDTVIVFGALHHLPNPKKGLAEINRVLAKKGTLLISEPTSNIIMKNIRGLVYKSRKHFSLSHKTFLHSELISLIKNSGFKIKKIKYFGMLAFPFSFPDIIPVLRYFPFPLLKILISIDSILLEMPIINSFRFATIILAEKSSKELP